MGHIVYSVLVPDWHEKKEPAVSPILEEVANQLGENAKALRQLSGDLQNQFRHGDPRLIVRYRSVEQGDPVTKDQERIYDRSLVTDMLGRWSSLQGMIRGWVEKKDCAPYALSKGLQGELSLSRAGYIRFTICMRGVNPEWFSSAKSLSDADTYASRIARVKKIEKELRNKLYKEDTTEDFDWEKKGAALRETRNLVDRTKLNLVQLADLLSQESQGRFDVTEEDVKVQLYHLRKRHQHYEMLKKNQEFELQTIGWDIPIILPEIKMPIPKRGKRQQGQDSNQGQEMES